MNEDKYVFFYGGIYSQWSDDGFFDLDNVYYNCAEQYMMAQKAMTFHDLHSYVKIMDEESPREQKALGKKVKNFNKVKWEKEAIKKVTIGNYFKFTQHNKLYGVLQRTGNKVIVEASPIDPIWGIGLSEDDDLIWNSDNWKGTNWLGIAIMRVRLMLFQQKPFDMKYLRTK